MSPSSTPACLAAALDYLARGWSVLPLCPPDHQEPLPPQHAARCTQPGRQPPWPWKQYQAKRASAAHVQLWWNRNPHCNVGIALGPVSGLVGLAVEGAAGEELLRQLADGDLPSTLEFTTPTGGRRLLYALGADGDVPVARTVAGPNGRAALRVLAHGSLTVLPPSGHARGVYAWVPGRGPGETEAAPCPAWLLRPPRLQPVADSGRPRADSPRAETIAMARAARRDVEWLWPGWLPLGKLAVLDGDPNLGKSTILLDLAARVSSHGRMPGDGTGLSGGVVLLAAEDGVEDTLLPRLLAAGADLGKVACITDVGGQPPVLPDHLPQIERVLSQLDARLLVIDPLTAYLAENSRSDQATRRALHPLAQMAARRRCTVLYLRHLNKQGATQAIYRGGGSIALIGAARSGLLVAADPDDPRRRVLAHIKHNLAPRQTSLRYALEYVAEFGCCRVCWLGRSPYSADELLQPPEEPVERTAIEEAMAFLRRALSDGPRLARDCYFQARILQISETTLRRAKVRAGVETVQGSDEAGRFTDVIWQLPSSPSPA
jgi:hypothetical protein